MKKGLYIALVAVLVIAFGTSAFYLGSYFLEGRKQEKRYDELAAMVEQAKEAEKNASAETTADTTPSTEGAEETSVPTEPTEPGEPTVLTCYKELHEQNPDMVGWLRIENTKIDYPVMQTSLNNRDYYLYRNFDKENSDRGSVYAREDCDIFRPSDNITLYGHNMRDGSMFAYLDNYYNKKTWEENPMIFFDTIYEFHTYKIFAVFKTTASVGQGFKYHQMDDAADEQAFNNFIATCKKLAFYDTGITPVYGDKIICLSTCEYTLENGRFVVAAVRIS